MRPYKEFASFLLIREQLLLGWKIMFFIVCGALIFVSIILAKIKLQPEDFLGVVLSQGVESTAGRRETFLIVRLDNGETARVRYAGMLDFRPGRRVRVHEIKTSLFGLKKYEFRGYLDMPLGKEARE
jgi:hypothetical protein